MRKLIVVAVIAILIAMHAQAHALMFVTQEDLEMGACYIYTVAKHADRTLYDKYDANVNNYNYIIVKRVVDKKAEVLRDYFGDVSLHVAKIANLLNRNSSVKISRNINYQSIIYNSMMLLKNLTLQERIKLFVALIGYESKTADKLLSESVGEQVSVLAYSYGVSSRQYVIDNAQSEFIIESLYWLIDKHRQKTNDEDAVLTPQKAELIWALFTGDVGEMRRILNSLSEKHNSAVRQVLNAIAVMNDLNNCPWPGGGRKQGR